MATGRYLRQQMQKRQRNIYREKSVKRVDKWDDDLPDQPWWIMLLWFVGAVVFLYVAILYLPLALAAITLITGVAYLVVRVFELVWGFSYHVDYESMFSVVLSAAACGAVFASLSNIFYGWMITLTLAYLFGFMKHFLIVFGMEATKWTQLSLIISAFFCLLLFPRFTLAVTSLSDDDDNERNMESNDMKKNSNDSNTNRKKKKKKEVELQGALVGMVEFSLLWLLLPLFINWVPYSWKTHQVYIPGFGLMQTWKFIRHFASFPLGIASVIAIPLALLSLLLEFTKDKEPSVVYFARGLKSVVCFLPKPIYLFYLWYFYCHPNLHSELESSLDHIISWALVCLIIGSLLWLVKTSFMLVWMARFVYNRFYDRIKVAGKQFYFLVCLLPDGWDDKISNANEDNVNLIQRYFRPQKSTQADDRVQSKAQGGENQDVPFIPTYQLQLITNYFKQIDALSDEERNLITKFNERPNVSKITSLKELQDTIEAVFEKKFTDDEVSVLHEQILHIDGGRDLDAENFKNWVEKVHRNCQILGETIYGAEENARHFDNLLRAFIAVVMILSWLLITKLITLELLTIIISPIMAATFIFGDAVKAGFQGILFAFFLHLIEVGDICVIDNTQMKVKRIGMWKTTFKKLDTKEEIRYQNSILASKMIVKRMGAAMDLNDSVEYSMPIHAWKPSTVEILKAHVVEFVAGNLTMYDDDYVNVFVREIQGNVKIEVHFKHKLHDEDMTYSDCFKKEQKNKANLLKEVKNFLQRQAPAT